MLDMLWPRYRFMSRASRGVDRFRKWKRILMLVGKLLVLNEG